LADCSLRGGYHRTLSSVKESSINCAVRRNYDGTPTGVHLYQEK
jgi:hypothetical protein